MNDWRKWLFFVAALYDGVIGLVFIFLWPQFYDHFRIAPPNHPGYVQFPALLLIIFGFMFLRIARDPDANRGLMDYGIALKLAYSGTVFWYEITVSVPSVWVWFAWIDLGFLVLFVIARVTVRQLHDRAAAA